MMLCQLGLKVWIISRVDFVREDFWLDLDNIITSQSRNQGKHIV